MKEETRGAIKITQLDKSEHLLIVACGSVELRDQIARMVGELVNGSEPAEVPEEPEDPEAATDWEPRPNADLTPKNRGNLRTFTVLGPGQWEPTGPQLALYWAVQQVFGRAVAKTVRPSPSGDPAHISFRLHGKLYAVWICRGVATLGVARRVATRDSAPKWVDAHDGNLPCITVRNHLQPRMVQLMDGFDPLRVTNQQVTKAIEAAGGFGEAPE